MAAGEYVAVSAQRDAERALRVLVGGVVAMAVSGGSGHLLDRLG